MIKTLKRAICTVLQAYGPDGLGILTVANVPGYTERRTRLLTCISQLAALPPDVLAKYEDPQSAYSYGWSHGAVLECTAVQLLLMYGVQFWHGGGVHVLLQAPPTFMLPGCVLHHHMTPQLLTPSHTPPVQDTGTAIISTLAFHLSMRQSRCLYNCCLQTGNLWETCLTLRTASSSLVADAHVSHRLPNAVCTCGPQARRCCAVGWLTP